MCIRYNRREEDQKIDLDAEITSVIQEQKTRSYDRHHMSSENRINLTLIAERNGLVVYNEGKLLILTPPRNLPVVFDEQAKYYFGKLFGKTFTENFYEEMKVFRLETELSLYLEELNKYGLAGLKRRDIILEQHLIDVISCNSQYQQLIARESVTFEEPKGFSPSFSFIRLVYNADNHEKFFISVDVKSSVFNAYRNLGIIEENTWEEFVAKFSPSKLFAINKGFRSRIFGKLDKHKKNAILIRKTAEPIVELLNSVPKWRDQMFVAENDEVLLRTTEPETDLQSMIALLNDAKILEKLNVRCYQLIKYDGYYVRKMLNGLSDVKGCRPDKLYEAYANLSKS